MGHVKWRDRRNACKRPTQGRSHPDPRFRGDEGDSQSSSRPAWAEAVGIHARERAPPSRGSDPRPAHVLLGRRCTRALSSHSRFTAQTIRQGARPVKPQGAVGGMSAALPELCAPEPLAARHDIERFANGVHHSLDQWLRERAHASEGLSARTYVVCTVAKPERVVGYFSIAAAVEQRSALPSAKLRRGMPELVPLLLIGRLAVDAPWRGRGLGSALLGDALKRCLAASEIAGVRGVVAHAIDEAAVGFYERHGFARSPLGERVMLMSIEAVRSFIAT